MIGLLLLLQASTAPTLADLKAMSPAAAGDAVLQGREHGPIAAFGAPTEWILEDVFKGELVEAPQRQGTACVRQRWWVTFSSIPRSDIGTATADQQSIYSTREIAEPVGGRCPSGLYAHLNPNTSVAQGEQALARLRDLRRDAGRTRFACSDTTRSGLCRDQGTIVAAVRALPPWLIDGEAGATVIGLGADVTRDTRLRIAPDPLAPVAITRERPAPF